MSMHIICTQKINQHTETEGRCAWRHVRRGMRKRKKRSCANDLHGDTCIHPQTRCRCRCGGGSWCCAALGMGSTLRRSAGDGDGEGGQGCDRKNGKAEADVIVVQTDAENKNIKYIYEP